MELRDYINAGILLKGNVTELAKAIDQEREAVSAAKSHKRGLPDEALSKLADLLGTDFRTIVAASRLVTERNEAKRGYWLPFVQNAPQMTRIASYALILGIVTNFVTPTSAEAAPLLKVRAERVCIM